MISKSVNIGIGLALAGALIVTIIFGQMKDFKIDVVADLQAHELVINEDIDETRGDIKEVVKSVRLIEKQQAILTLTVADIANALDKTSTEHTEALDKLRDLVEQRYYEFSTQPH